VDEELLEAVGEPVVLVEVLVPPLLPAAALVPEAPLLPLEAALCEVVAPEEPPLVGPPEVVVAGLAVEPVLPVALELLALELLVPESPPEQPQRAADTTTTHARFMSPSPRLRRPREDAV
jgi:hypothetical protein